MQRYCLALVLPHPLGSRLDRARQLLQPQRRHMAAHITLAPPVDLSDDDARAAASLIHGVAASHQPIAIELRGADTFAPRASTAFLRVTSGADEIRVLAAEVEQAPFQALNRPMHPHVTLVSRAPQGLVHATIAAFDDFAADSGVDAMTLFRLTDVGWQPFSEGRMGGSRP